MKSNLLLIRNKLKNLLSDKEVIELFVFGSSIKGKVLPRDIDIAILTYKKLSLELQKKISKITGFHISVLTAKEFFINPPSIAHTLIREGYGLKNKKFLAESYRFSNKILFSYSMVSFPSSMKVKIVNILRGKKGGKGIVEFNGGEWIANQVFSVPLESEKIFDEFFDKFSIKFKKSYILIH